MAGCSALDDGVAHVEIVEVVARVAEHERLEVGETRLVVGEEFIVESFLAEALVGVDSEGLQDSIPRLSASHAGLAELVDDAVLPLVEEELDVEGPSPVVALVVAVVGVDAYLRVVEIAVVDGDGDNGDGDIAPVADIRLCRGSG